MVWAKLDDQILDNPKIANAGVFGFALHVAAITYCCRTLSDGFVPVARVACLLDFGGVMWDRGNPAGVAGVGESMGGRHGGDPNAIAVHLVMVGLWRWDEERRGYWLNDFLDYNPSKEKVLSERKRATVRKDKVRPEQRMLSVRNSGLVRPESARTSAEPRPESAAGSDGPVPVPVPKRSIGTASPPPDAAPKSRRKPETPCPESGATPEAVKVWADGWKIPVGDPEFQRFLDHHRKGDARWRDWAAAWRTWQGNVSRFAKREPYSQTRMATQPEVKPLPIFRGEDWGKTAASSDEATQAAKQLQKLLGGIGR